MINTNEMVERIMAELGEHMLASPSKELRTAYVAYCIKRAFEIAMEEHDKEEENKK